MKKTTLRILILLFIIALTPAAQGQQVYNLTPGGVFDQVYDRFGREYALADLSLSAARPIGNPSTPLSSLPLTYCTAGRFNIYYNTSSVFLQSTLTQSIICQVFSDISGLLMSPMASSDHVNIFCDATGTGFLAQATSFYCFPLNPTNPNQGIIDGQVYKMLTSGVDPYLNIPITYTNAANFYHGYLNINPAPQNALTNTTWHEDPAALPGFNQFDLYSVILHEVVHALGFASLIDNTGFSKFGQSNNYFSRYDQFLTDASGISLLSNSATSCTGNYTVSPTALTCIASVNSGCTSDITNCTAAAQYVSPSTHVKVYTPNCFEAASSLSHFEDMCTTPTFTPTAPFGCIPSPTTPGVNNLYFAMANQTSPGSCYTKRFIKEEERMVLCDLGYAVTGTYQSALTALIDGISNAHSYTTGCFSNNTIVGINDGLLNGSYAFTTNGSSISIPLSTLLSNDLPATGLSVSCVEAVYTSNATQISASISGANLIVVANAGAGLAIIKYYPTNGTHVGNATYVFVYFLPGNCNPINACNMIQNGGFENTPGGSLCGLMNVVFGGTDISCWQAHEGNPIVLARGCTANGGGNYNLGTSTIGSAPAVMNSFNGNGNDRVLTLYHSPANGINTESVKNNLGNVLVPGSGYRLSFMAANVTGTASGYNNSPTPSPVVITIASNPNFAFSAGAPYPSGLNVIAEFTINPGNSWTQTVHDFTFSSPGNLNHGALLIGINSAATQALGLLTVSTGVMCYLDQVSLLPVPQPVFSTNTFTMCGNGSMIDLDVFTSVPSTGSFSGAHVSYTGGTYNFNVPPVILPPGNYPIAYTYTNGSCQNTVYDFITISDNTNIFQLNNTALCSGAYTVSLPYLLQTLSTLSGNTFSVNGVAVPGYTYAFTPPGVFTISATSSHPYLCNNSSTCAVSVYTTPTLAAFSLNNISGIDTYSICGNYTTVTGFAYSGNATDYLWQPGNLNTMLVTLSPSVSTIYTLSAYNYSECPVTQTFAVNIFTNCCYANFTAPAFSGTSLNTTLAGDHMILNNILIPPGSHAVLSAGEFLMAQDVKITVANTASLTIDGAHLFSCTDKMWKGIVVQDGGYLNTTITTLTSNLIEDAITAVDVSSHSNANTTDPILDISNTVFNKNHIAISISNYHKNVAAYPFSIHSNVFTCRDLPVVSGQWPQSGTAATGDLRYAAITSGLAPPYAGTYATGNLKAPYNGQPSHTGIRIDDVGLTSGNNYFGVTIGSATAANFNVFDTQGTGIAALNSNVKSTNNVFQNTQRYPAPTAPGATNIVIEGGTGIESIFTSAMYGNLDLQAASAGTGNRFWNCHTGVSGKKLYGFDIRYATFRSTQSRFAAPGPYGDPGNMAINLNTSKFKYYIYSNEFTNVKNAINIPILSTPACPVCVPGPSVYAANITVLKNTFAPGTGIGNYLEQAVNITCANGAPVTIAPSTLPGGPGGSFATGVMIEYNQLNDVLRGIYVQGITGFRTFINENEVSLQHDYSSADQHGIDLSNHKDGGISTGVGQIIANTVSGSTETMDNTQASLIYNSLNQGICSPSISCNSVSNAYQGFVFSGLNTVLTSFWGTRWLSNKMKDLKRGMVLTNLGKIGQQGAINYGTGNSWNGTWTGNKGIYTYNSFADQSKLYISGSTAPAYPPNLDGTPIVDSYVFAPNSILNTSVPSFFSCSEPEQFIEPDPVKDPNYGSASVAYMADMGLYWLVKHNDSIKAANGELSDFYTSLAGSNIDLLSQTEEHLYAGHYLMARTILSSIAVAADNTIESNYKNFYGMYANYQQSVAEGGSFSPADSTALNDLAQLCPAYNGACIYQARALYNGIYNTVSNYKDCLDPGKARLANYDAADQMNPAEQKTWDVTLFPNPAKDQLNIVSKTANDKLHITILDLTGRTIMKQDIKASGFIANLGLSLTNGAYFITISNQDKKTITKKLIIAE